jgi:hypothetical protein
VPVLSASVTVMWSVLNAWADAVREPIHNNVATSSARPTTSSSAPGVPMSTARTATVDDRVCKKSAVQSRWHPCPAICCEGILIAHRDAVPLAQANGLRRKPEDGWNQIVTWLRQIETLRAAA